MLAPILQVSSTQILVALQQTKSIRLSRQGRLAGRQRQAPGARAERHRDGPSVESVYDSSPVPGLSFASNLLGFRERQRCRSVWCRGLLQLAAGRGPTDNESTLTDVNGNAIVLGRQQKVPAKDGDNLELGLDSQIQYDAEIALADGVMSSEFRLRDADGDGHQDRRHPCLGAVPVVQRQ